MPVAEPSSTENIPADQDDFNGVVEEMTRSISSVRETIKKLLLKLVAYNTILFK